MGFDPCNRTLKFGSPFGLQFPQWEFTWECEGSFPHALCTFFTPETCDVIHGPPSWLVTLQPPCLGRKPKARVVIKAKSRKINYEKRNEQIGYNEIKVDVDNNMHISGYARMYQQALHYKWTLH